MEGLQRRARILNQLGRRKIEGGRSFASNRRRQRNPQVGDRGDHNLVDVRLGTSLTAGALFRRHRLGRNMLAHRSGRRLTIGAARRQLRSRFARRHRARTAPAQRQCHRYHQHERKIFREPTHSPIIRNLLSGSSTTHQPKPPPYRNPLRSLVLRRHRLLPPISYSRSQESGARSQEPGARSQESGVRSQDNVVGVPTTVKRGNSVARSTPLCNTGLTPPALLSPISYLLSPISYLLSPSLNTLPQKSPTHP